MVVGGVAKGCTSIQLQLLQAGSVVSGWAWGQQSIANFTVDPSTGIWSGKVVWSFCAVMAVLAAIGGYLAARFSRRVNQKLMRRIVAVIGFLTAAYFFWHAYGPKA